MHNVDIRNVRLGQMQYFVKAVEYGSITKAAEYYHLSQPTLSKQLKSLEAQLDIQLFVRYNNALQLTPAGKHLYEAWYNRINYMEEEIQEAHLLQEGINKSLVIGFLDSFRTDTMLVPAINRFCELHTDVRIRVETDSAHEIKEMLEHDDVDAIFSVFYDFQDVAGSGIEFVSLGETPLCVCMKRSNPLAKYKELTVDMLKQSRFICISPQRLPEYVEMVQMICHEHGFSPYISEYVSSANSLTLNLRYDQDVFVCDRYYADLCAEGHCLIPLKDTKSNYVIAWKKSNSKAHLKEFIGVAMESVKKENKQ